MTFVSYTSAHPQVAFAIGRRFGTAVERNRARRRLRAALAAAWAVEPGPSGGFLISGGRSVLLAEFAALVDAVEGCLRDLRDRQAPVMGERPLAGAGSLGSGPGEPTEIRSSRA
jgi:ribonuclease P protein component